MGKRNARDQVHLEQHLNQLRARLLYIKRQRETAEARAAGINDLVAEISKTGLLLRTALLGPIIHERYYAPVAGGRDSGQIVQAALLVPGGLGVLRVDSEVGFELSRVPDALAEEAWLYHMPFEQCEPAIQALLEPHIEDLVEGLVRLISE